jgi:hypothetical protein
MYPEPGFVRAKREFRQQYQHPGIVPPKLADALREVIEAECFGPHSWQPSISSDGVKIEIARLRAA